MLGKILSLKAFKRVIPAFASLLIISCGDEKARSNEDAEVAKVEENFDWLNGKWQRSNEEPGRETFESWVKVDPRKYHGVGYTFADEDTIWSEEMVLVEEGETWNLKITGAGDSLPTIFKLTSVEGKSFTSENEQNEFPKQIRYTLEGDTLKAVISGGGPEIPFIFVHPEK